MIETHGAALHYDDHGRRFAAVGPLSMQVLPGEFLGILGPSGSGKSSLLYLLCGLKAPTEGTVTWNGQDLAALSDDARAQIRLKDFGFVFQHPYLLGYLSVLENVLVARPDSPDEDEAVALLKTLDIDKKMRRYPHELSGGERQRVCVARAIYGRPKIIFADEPTAALDHANGFAVVQLLREYRGDGSLVLVTHDPSMLEGADRILRMNDGESEFCS